MRFPSFHRGCVLRGAFPHKLAALLLGFPLLNSRAAQIDSTWGATGASPGLGSYSDAANWSPQVVPNNGNGGNTYRVTIARSGPSLDLDVTIDSLTLKPQGVLVVRDHTFSTSATRNDAAAPLPVNGQWYDLLPGIAVGATMTPAKADLGVLANFDASTGALVGGVYSVDNFEGGPPAEITFKGARIVTSLATLRLRGTGGRITNEAGNDALAPLAVNNGVLFLDQRPFRTAGDFTNNGELDLVPDGEGDTSFIISGKLTNFDPATKTLKGGKFVLYDPSFHGYTTRLQFAGADIVTNSADLFVAAMRDETTSSPTGIPSIVDENGQNALRNFANNTATGRIVFDDPEFTTTATSVTNAGYIAVGDRLFLPAGGTFEQTGGELFIRGRFTSLAAELDTQGGSILVNGGRVTGGGILIGATTNNGVIAPGIDAVADVMTFNGDLTLGSASVLRFDLAGTARGPGVGSHLGGPVYGYDTIDGTAKVTIGGKLQVNLSTATQSGSRFTPGPDDTFVLLKAPAPPVGSFQNVASGQRLATVDGGGSFQVNYGAGTAFDPNSVVLSGFQANTNPATLLNISTRGQSGTGERAMIGGFIVTGSEPKAVLLRALGPSLRSAGVTTVLDDPTLSLHDGNGAPITSNDDWQQSSGHDAIEGTGIAPSDARESAISATLTPGAYTGVLEGKNGAAGTSLVEVYDLNAGAQSQLANISTRAFADGAENPVIGGMIVGGGSGSSRVLVRALGPSLSKAGVKGAMDNPYLTLVDKNGNALATSDDWKKEADQAAIQATGIPPNDDREAAIVYTLQPGAYTAVVKPSPAGGPANSGVALVEFYRLP